MWRVEHAVSEEVWFQDYVGQVIAGDTLALPEATTRLGSVETTWFETEPGVAMIMAAGGTVDDRLLGRAILSSSLQALGYRVAQFSFDEKMQRSSSWDDIMAKAKRLIQSGNVQLLRNGYNVVVGHVVGDHGEYQTEIAREDPDSRTITQWTCDCPWDQYAFQRTRQWKKYEARPCAHVLATYWKSLGTPLDEDVAPGQEGRPPTQVPSGTPTSFPGGGPQAPPSMPGMGMPPGSITGPPAPAPIPAPGQQGQLFDPNAPSQTAPFMAPPGEQGVIPPYPMEESGQLVMPVSVPGGNPGPYPANPIQQPGTLSHVSGTNDVFENGSTARLEEATFGIAEGKSQAHGAGGYREVPKNAIVEVLGQDSTTGWVDVIYPLAESGPMEPFHVRMFVEPEKLTPLDRSTPFIKRRSDHRDSE